MLKIAVTIFAGLLFSWSGLAETDRCRDAFPLPHVEDGLKLRQGIAVDDSRPERLQRPGNTIPLASAQTEWATCREGYSCRRVIRVSGTPVAGEQVGIEATTRFRIQRRASDGTIFLATEDRNRVRGLLRTMGIPNYLRVECSITSTSPDGMATSGDEVPCNNDDINRLFINMTKERCDQMQNGGSGEGGDGQPGPDQDGQTG